jgi:predicted transposase YdaD
VREGGREKRKERGKEGGKGGGKKRGRERRREGKKKGSKGFFPNLLASALRITKILRLFDREVLLFQT